MNNEEIQKVGRAAGLAAWAEFRKVVICGSRGYTNSARIKHIIEMLHPETLVITGGAAGADTLAHEAAKARGLKTMVMNADWKKHGKTAGFIRNIAMLKENPDIVLAFWDGVSRGTLHTITNAKLSGIPHITYMMNDLPPQDGNNNNTQGENTMSKKQQNTQEEKPVTPVVPDMRFEPLNGPEAEGEFVDYKKMPGQAIVGLFVMSNLKNGSLGNRRLFHTLEKLDGSGRILIPGCSELDRTLEGLAPGTPIRVTFKCADTIDTPAGVRTINRVLVERAVLAA